MEEKPQSELPPQPGKPRAIWKLWLGIAIAIGCIVWAQMEAHSPKAELQRQQGARNVANAIYGETYSECSGTTSEQQCRQQAEEAADFARRKMAPLVNK